MSMEQIRRTYGVPAKRGMSVRYIDGEKSQWGRIVGSRGMYLRIRFEGLPYVCNFHPTYNLAYASDP